MMSGGISEALVTTQLGLAVAVPIMILHHILERRVDRIIGDMEEKGTGFAVALMKLGKIKKREEYDAAAYLTERMADYFQAGGDIMVPLFTLSLIMWTLAIVKIIRFVREQRKEPLPSRVVTFSGESSVCKAGIAQWQWDILSQYMEQKCDDSELNREMLEAMRMRQEVKSMRYIGTILILAAVAPLLGLLGTVTGMITTFDVISQFGTGNARALASGISEALVTTQSGLVVAVPGLLLGGFLFQRAQKFKGRMELFCIGLQHQTEVSAR